MAVSGIVGFLCWLFFNWVDDKFRPPLHRIGYLLVAVFLGYISLGVLVVMYLIDDDFKTSVLRKITGR